MSNVLLAVAALLVVISAIQPLARRLMVSDAVLLALVGTLIGGGATFLLQTNLTTTFDEIAALFVHFPVNSQVFLYVFLPVLVFHGSLSIDVRRLARDTAPVLVLAVLAVVATTAAVGFALQPIAGQPLAVCLLLGAIVATTDPSAVISIFRDIGADGRLTRLVEGESLLNDAAAIALFTILLGAVTRQQEPDIATAAMLLATSFAGGAVIGHILARVMLTMMPLLGGNRAAEFTLTLALPYLSYIVCDEFLGFSGVVSAACAGLTVSAIGPSVLRPRSWSFLVDVWGQLSFLATSLVFVLASMLVPRLMLGLRLWDLLLIVVVVAAALVARAAVLFGVLPLLRYSRLAQRVPFRLKLPMLWGGLRGAITLAMALAVTENWRVPVGVKEFVAILATGFVLFTLLVNGTTLRFLVRWLRLDQLPAIDQALRHQVLAIGLAEVRDRLHRTVTEFGFVPQAAQQVVTQYERRVATETEANSFDAALTDRDRVRLGLLTFASQEKAILLEIFRERGVSRTIMEQLLRTADNLIDATRAEGRLGYLRAASRRLRPSPRLRLAQVLHRRLRIDGPLTRVMTERFEMLLIMHMVFLAQLQFLRERMEPVLGARVAEVVTDIAQRRRTLLEDAMAALHLQYPGYAEALQTRLARQIGLRFEADAYTALHREALLSDELFGELLRDIEARRDTLLQPMTFDLQAGLTGRLHGIPLFSTLSEPVLHDIAMRLTMRFAVPGERILKRRRGTSMVYLISSGEVEIDHAGRQTRLGAGGLFGGDGMLGEAETQGTVTAMRFCHLLELRTGFFRHLLDDLPELRDRLAGPAEPLRLPAPETAAEA
ncbi:Sodium:proton antiporter [Rhodovastum atsumiense]|uniref:cation:proton antiporter n=1 Tax=Rhodovastum atsumiense TaxID=504468 RepID=UPI001EF11547|nr:cation:proton antiporter [Rhodovastum atsumiense]CAH2601057.1 Sodium:proton antiporter [Rhodovastum atsumiense]